MAPERSLTFLNNYPGELDRARAWKENPNAHTMTRSNGRPQATKQDFRKDV